MYKLDIARDGDNLLSFVHWSRNLVAGGNRFFQSCRITAGDTKVTEKDPTTISTITTTIPNLSSLSWKTLEDVLSMEMIQKLKCLPMAVFVPEVWKAFGSHCVLEEHRIKDLDWESNCTHLYCCDVDSDGKIMFKFPCFGSSDEEKKVKNGIKGGEGRKDARKERSVSVSKVSLVTQLGAPMQASSKSDQSDS